MEKKRKNKSKFDVADPQQQEPETKKLSSQLQKVKRDFLDVSRYQAKRENLLLGEFSSDGKYSLKDETIMQELLSMPKVLQERVDNVVYAYTKYKGYNLNFKVELDISESYCSAEMFLIEIEHTPEDDIKHLTSLGNFVEIYSPKFRENVYKTWNINLQETPLDKEGTVFENMKVMEGERNFSKELVEILSQLYIVRLLKLLDNCGTLGLKIQGDYRALVEELIRKDPSLAQDHTRLKQILDRMIAKHNGFEAILKMPGGAEVLKNYSQPIDRVRGKNSPVLVDTLGERKEEVKPAQETRKEAPKKKKSKSKGGDGGKPFVWSIKNYDPQVLTTIEVLKNVLPTREAAPVATQTEPTQSQPRTRREGPIFETTPIAAEPTASEIHLNMDDDDLEVEDLLREIAGETEEGLENRGKGFSDDYRGEVAARAQESVDKDGQEEAAEAAQNDELDEIARSATAGLENEAQDELGKLEWGNSLEMK